MRRPLLTALLLAAAAALLVLRRRSTPVPVAEVAMPEEPDTPWVEELPTTELPVQPSPTRECISGTLDDLL